MHLVVGKYRSGDLGTFRSGETRVGWPAGGDVKAEEVKEKLYTI